MSKLEYLINKKENTLRIIDKTDENTYIEYSVAKDSLRNYYLDLDSYLSDQTLRVELVEDSSHTSYCYDNIFSLLKVVERLNIFLQNKEKRKFYYSCELVSIESVKNIFNKKVFNVEFEMMSFHIKNLLEEDIEVLRAAFSKFVEFLNYDALLEMGFLNKSTSKFYRENKEIIVKDKNNAKILKFKEKIYKKNSSGKTEFAYVHIVLSHRQQRWFIYEDENGKICTNNGTINEALINVYKDNKILLCFRSGMRVFVPIDKLLYVGTKKREGSVLDNDHLIKLVLDGIFNYDTDMIEDFKSLSINSLKDKYICTLLLLAKVERYDIYEESDVYFSTRKRIEDVVIPKLKDVVIRGAL